MSETKHMQYATFV